VRECVLCVCFFVFECSWLVFSTRYIFECASVVQCVRLSAFFIFCTPNEVLVIVHKGDDPEETEQHTIQRLLFLRTTTTSRNSNEHKYIYYSV